MGFATPLSGLNVAQSLISTASENISRMMDPEARQIQRTTYSRFADGQGMGVVASAPQRIVDQSQTDDLLGLTSLRSFYQNHNASLSSITKIIGSSQGDNSFSLSLKKFQTTTDALIAQANVPARLTENINALKKVCEESAYITENFTELRGSADKAISEGVKQINTYLQNVADFNATIRNNGNVNNATKDLNAAKDALEAQIRSIGEFINIRTEYKEDGTIRITTANNAEIVDYSVTPFSFTPTVGISPSSSYALGTVSPIMVGTIDVTNAFSSGKIAALVKTRDETIPNLQAQYDGMMSMFRDQVNSIHNKGTGWPPATTLSGTRTFTNPVTDTFQGTGVIRFGVVDRTTGNLVANYDLDLTALGPVTIQNLANDISANLSAATGGAVTCVCDATSDNGLKLASSNSNYGIGMVSIGAEAIENTTSLGFSHYFGLNDLIATGTINTSGTTPPGIAGELSVRSDIAANNTLLSRGQLNAGAIPPLPDVLKAITDGDDTIASQLNQVLKETHNFVTAGGMPQLQVSFMGYAAQIVASHSQANDNAVKQFKTQDTIYAQVKQDISRVSGINLQEQMTNIFQYQTMYAACGKCVEANKKNFDILMSIV